VGYTYRVKNSGATSRGEYELLCERCGYSIEGRGREAMCPECALAVRQSLPANRTGTPFQRRPRWDGFWPTARLMLLEPGVVWATVQPVWWLSWRLQNYSLLTASVAYGVGLALTLMPRFPDPGGEFDLAIVVGLFAAIPVFILGFLSWRVVEASLMAIHRTPHGRMDKALAVTLVAHASFGLWPGGAALLALGLACRTGILPPAYEGIGAAVAGGLGVFWFAGLTIWGARELRYANRLPEWLDATEGRA